MHSVLHAPKALRCATHPCLPCLARSHAGHPRTQIRTSTCSVNAAALRTTTSRTAALRTPRRWCSSTGSAPLLAGSSVRAAHAGPREPQGLWAATTPATLPATLPCASARARPVRRACVHAAHCRERKHTPTTALPTRPSSCHAPMQAWSRGSSLESSFWKRKPLLASCSSRLLSSSLAAARGSCVLLPLAAHTGLLVRSRARTRPHQITKRRL